MNIGLDKISFYSPNQYIDMKELAHHRDTDPNKYTIGLGQDEMAISNPTQDPVTMAANAAIKILDTHDLDSIDLVLFATETGLDYSKALSVYVRHLLDIQPFARCIELKEACYSGTAAIQLAKSHIASNPDKRVLIVMADISRYGLHTAGEPTQGAGAVAIVMSRDPKLLILEDESSYFTDDVMDFWRPNYSRVAMVDGKYSNEQYQRFFDVTYNNYLNETGRTIDDFKAHLFHIPYTKIGLKALQSITDDQDKIDTYLKSTTYNRRIGNIYTGSLFLSLISLLDSKTLASNERIGLYSYGSGSVAEFYSMRTVDGYQKHLYPSHLEDLDSRTKVDIDTYEKIFNFSYPTDGSLLELDTSNDKGPFVLSHIENHIRYYTKK
ncbi:MAG: hydroxymethylglutaryl-CoA synthase [Erysipelothrix sp.]|nr:hydroxymethylglutaryl-CoA synthase [Erysipelothrix sp.]